MAELTELIAGGLLREGGFVCPDCGRKHSAALKKLAMGKGVLDSELASSVRSLGSKPFIIDDVNTKKAAGDRVRRILRDSGIPFGGVTLADGTEPDDAAVGYAAMSFDTSCDVILAVGSGVIGDISKALASVARRPYMICATAPSMDGYASNSSSMIYGGVKTSLYTSCPEIIIADEEVLCAAPVELLRSGIGDMLAKYISVCEWRMSSIINGEYFCKYIAQMMRDALGKCVDAADGIPGRSPEAVMSVTSGLILSGIAMSFAKVSRPASGIEHYFSHIWDMSSLEKGTPASLHGVQAGIGTVLSLLIYDDLRHEKPSREKAMAHMNSFSQKRWESEITRVFPKTGASLIELEKKELKNDGERHAKRLESIIANWDEIIAVMDAELPQSGEILGLLRSVGAPALPRDIGIEAPLVRDSMVASRDLRDKYIASSLLWDLGLLDEYADKLIIKTNSLG